MRRIKFISWNKFSEGCRDLARGLGAKRLKEGSNYIPTSRTTVINWGSSNARTYPNMLNKPESVYRAAHKLHTFNGLASNNISVPDFTTSKQVAEGWLLNGYVVVERHKLTGHNGDGIRIVDYNSDEDTITDAPLYVKYQKKDHEYRVHVFKDRVIDVTEKRRRHGVEGGDGRIRNLANGWVFCRDGVNAPEAVRSVAVAAIRALGLDFGAVDVIEREGRAWVLEINTAPGLQGTTLDKYIEAIKSVVPDVVPKRQFTSKKKTLPKVRFDGKRLIKTKKGNYVYR